METPTRLSVIASMPTAVREETWRREVTYGDETRVTQAEVSVLPGELVLVTVEVMRDLLRMVGFEQVE